MGDYHLCYVNCYIYSCCSCGCCPYGQFTIRAWVWAKLLQRCSFYQNKAKNSITQVFQMNVPHSILVFYIWLETSKSFEFFLQLEATHMIFRIVPLSRFKRVKQFKRLCWNLMLSLHELLPCSELLWADV